MARQNDDAYLEYMYTTYSMHFTAPQIVLPDQALPLLAFNATTMSELIRRDSYWVPDYSWIRQTQGESKPITPKKTVEHHELSLPWLNKELQIGHAGSTVVVKRLIASKGKKLKESRPQLPLP